MTTKIIDEYEINLDDWVGTGSFATVYKGKHSKTGNVIAIKEIDVNKIKRNHHNCVDGDKIMRNISSEIRTMRLMHHSNILKMIDIIIKGDMVYLILEYCDLGDLSKYIKMYRKIHTNDTCMSETHVRDIITQLMKGMKYMNSMGIVHRDLKPQNILLKSDDNKISMILKISDFGFARILKENESAETICGSPIYMSPEILLGYRYTNNTDLWSVGVIMYEMIVGMIPITARTMIELAERYKSMKGIQIPENVHISRECRDLIERLLIIDAQNRISWDDFINHKWFNTEIKIETSVSDVPLVNDIQFCGSAPARLQKNTIIDTDISIIKNIVMNEMRTILLSKNDIDDIVYELRCWVERIKTLIDVGYSDINSNYYISGYKIFTHCSNIIESIRHVVNEKLSNELTMIIEQMDRMHHECSKIINMCSRQILPRDKCKTTEKLIYDKALTLEERGMMNVSIDNIKNAYDDFMKCINLFETILPFTTNEYKMRIKVHLTKCINAIKRICIV